MALTRPSVSEHVVFLSFRRKDTGRTFTDHLYHELCRNGVRVFPDKDKLCRGTNISDVVDAIEKSEMFVPIFSKNYAHSKLCVKEIETMMRVATEGEHKRLVLPVFYKIELAHVRLQTGPFKEAFQKHEKDEKVEMVKKWRAALTEATEFSGYESEQISDGYEAPLVELIVQRILEGLKNNYPQDDIEDLVGIKSRENYDTRKQESPRRNKPDSPLSGSHLQSYDLSTRQQECEGTPKFKASSEEVPEFLRKVNAWHEDGFILSKLMDLQYYVISRLKQLLNSLKSRSSNSIKFLRETCPCESYPCPCRRKMTESSIEVEDRFGLASPPPGSGSQDANIESLQNHHNDQPLRALYLSGSMIQEFPTSIWLRKDLQILHLDHCRQLKEVPKWIADLCLLKELSLSNCPLITGLPDGIRSLTHLLRLNLSHCNKIQVLPDSIGDLESLAVLLLENTSLIEFPDSVGRLRKLEILHLGSCKKLKKLPSSIKNLENLTQLILDGTNIQELPNSIASLQKLEFLSIRGCRISKPLPKDLGKGLLLLRGGSQVESCA